MEIILNELSWFVALYMRLLIPNPTKNHHKFRYADLSCQDTLFVHFGSFIVVNSSYIMELPISRRHVKDFTS